MIKNKESLSVNNMGKKANKVVPIKYVEVPEEVKAIKRQSDDKFKELTRLSGEVGSLSNKIVDLENQKRIIDDKIKQSTLGKKRTGIVEEIDSLRSNLGKIEKKKSRVDKQAWDLLHEYNERVKKEGVDITEQVMKGVKEREDRESKKKSKK